MNLLKLGISPCEAPRTSWSLQLGSLELIKEQRENIVSISRQVKYILLDKRNLRTEMKERLLIFGL